MNLSTFKLKSALEYYQFKVIKKRSQLQIAKKVLIGSLVLASLSLILGTISLGIAKIGVIFSILLGIGGGGTAIISSCQTQQYLQLAMCAFDALNQIAVTA